jgi:hypothetical protein
MPITFKQDLEKVDLQRGNIIELCDKLEIQTPAAREFLRVACANTLLMDRKQRDYGPRNISGFGTFGVLVRMNDKMERLKTLFGSGRKKKAQNESIVDTLRDVSNYPIIALLIELGRWPNE